MTGGVQLDHGPGELANTVDWGRLGWYFVTLVIAASHCGVQLGGFSILRTEDDDIVSHEMSQVGHPSDWRCPTRSLILGVGQHSRLGSILVVFCDFGDRSKPLWCPTWRFLNSED